MGKTSLILSLIGLGLAAIGIPVTLDQLGVMDLGGEKSGISFNLMAASSDSASLTISNSEGGIAFVDKIELITDNFVRSPECTNKIIALQRTPANEFERVFLKPEPETYSLENYRTKGGSSGKLSTGLHYAKDDIDSFRVIYTVVDSDGNPLTDTVTFDVKFSLLWCDPNDCNKKSAHTETQNVEFVGICETKQCEFSGGLWGIWGNQLSATASCNPSTSDEGMECSDSSQCQSFCQAKEGSEINSESTGTCYGYELAICMQEVQNGVVQAEWCQ